MNGKIKTTDGKVNWYDYCWGTFHERRIRMASSGSKSFYFIGPKRNVIRIRPNWENCNQISEVKC